MTTKKEVREALRSVREVCAEMERSLKDNNAEYVGSDAIRIAAAGGSRIEYRA